MESAGSGHHGAAEFVETLLLLLLLLLRRWLLLDMLSHFWVLDADVVSVLLQDSPNFPSTLIRILTAIQHPTM